MVVISSVVNKRRQKGKIFARFLTPKTVKRFVISVFILFLCTTTHLYISIIFYGQQFDSSLHNESYKSPVNIDSVKTGERRVPNRLEFTRLSGNNQIINVTHTIGINKDILKKAQIDDKVDVEEDLKEGEKTKQKLLNDIDELDEREFKDLVKNILSGEMDLANMRIDDTFLTTFTPSKVSDTTADFCFIDWEVYRKDPPGLPMFPDLMKKSNCTTRTEYDEDGEKTKRRTSKRLYFQEIVDLVKWYDVSHGIQTVEPTGFIFHESRCGSTLASNMLVAVDPNITFMYSESQPLFKTIRACVERQNPLEECNRTKTTELLRDIMYMMTRQPTKSSVRKRVFFKFIPFDPLGFDIILEAFPTVPWIFIFRNPSEVMASNFQGPNKDFCLNNLKWDFLPSSLVDMLKARKGENLQMDSITNIEYCAANLGNFCQAAILQHQKYTDKKASTDTFMGKFVNYSNLKHIMIERIIPDHFNLPFGDEQRKNVVKVADEYSKRKGLNEETHRWMGDSENKIYLKENPIILESVDLFLSDPYEYLEAVSEKL